MISKTLPCSPLPSTTMFPLLAVPPDPWIVIGFAGVPSTCDSTERMPSEYGLNIQRRNSPLNMCSGGHGFQVKFGRTQHRQNLLRSLEDGGETVDAHLGPGKGSHRQPVANFRP